ncbi:MAG: malonyl CoA-acyl carrier protein transacylase [Planctomycetota bacterium]|nr:MAG: malonyl CoA-acyl carrier protein transacylase [Planctomycetota bacterium]
MKTAIIFPGQGAQSAGMGLDLYEVSPVAKRLFEEANRILGFDLADLCFHGPAEKLEQTDIQQPAIFVTSVATYEAFLERGGKRESFAFAGGLSLGEYTALYAAGSFDFQTGLVLVRRRGELMQEAARMSAGAMASLIGAEAAEAEALCAEAREGAVLAPANLNCPGQVVISGTATAVSRAVGLAEARGWKAVRLAVAGAFHSPLMQPAAEGLGRMLEASRIEAPRIPVIRNVDAAYHADPADIRRGLAAQLTSPVLWQRDVERMIADGAERFIEFGPGRVLTGLMRKINRGVECVNVSTAAGIAAAAAN